MSEPLELKKNSQSSANELRAKGESRASRTGAASEMGERKTLSNDSRIAQNGD
ncbi:MAG: hypothetical protein ACR2N3_10465 [Pyrinomonadaceae bacterium]